MSRAKHRRMIQWFRFLFQVACLPDCILQNSAWIILAVKGATTSSVLKHWKTCKLIRARHLVLKCFGVCFRRNHISPQRFAHNSCERTFIHDTWKSYFNRITFTNLTFRIYISQLDVRNACLYIQLQTPERFTKEPNQNSFACKFTHTITSLT